MSQGENFHFFFYFKVKGSVQDLEFKIFNGHLLENTIKANCTKLQTQVQFYRKEPGNSFSTAFCVRFLKNNVSHVTFC